MPVTLLVLGIGHWLATGDYGFIQINFIEAVCTYGWIKAQGSALTTKLVSFAGRCGISLSTMQRDSEDGAQERITESRDLECKSLGLSTPWNCFMSRFKFQISIQQTIFKPTKLYKLRGPGIWQRQKRKKKLFNANNMTSCKHIRISTWNLLEKSVIACAGACSISQEALVVIANKILRIGYDCYKAFMTK